MAKNSRNEKPRGLVLAQQADEKMGPVKKGFTRFLQVSTADKTPTAKFWRAGIKHTAVPVNHALDKFMPDQVIALFEEPRLKVELVDVADKDAQAAEQAQQ